MSAGVKRVGVLDTVAPDHRESSALGTALRVAAGNLLEMYDFMVFGYYAAEIGYTFFPGKDPVTTLLLSFMTFGAGFLMRPIGALVLGAYVDRIGVRQGLLVTLSLMAVGTVAVALMPGYSHLGILAPLFVLLARLIQGFSAGVELGTSSVFLSLIAPPGLKGFFVSFQSASQQLAVVAAAGLGFCLNVWLAPEQIQSWGWRLPMLAGCAIVPFLYLLRRGLSDHVGEPTSAPPTVSLVAATLLRHWRRVGVGLALVLMTTASFYTITAYMPSFGRSVLHLPAKASFTVTLCVGLSNLLWLPLSGAISDRVGRRPILIAASVLAALTAYPVLVWVASAPSFGRLLAGGLWLSFLYGTYNGAMVVFLTEFIPREVRTSGFSLAYSLATCVGGLAPAITTSLIAQTKNPAMPGAVLAVAASFSFLAALAAGRFSQPDGG